MNNIIKGNWEIIEEKIIKPMYEDGYFPLTLADEVAKILQQQLTKGWIPEVMNEVLGSEATELLLSSKDEFIKWLERGKWNCRRLNELSNRNNGWIPVDSGLPVKGRYLVTTAYGQVKESSFDIGMWWQIDNSVISLAWVQEPIKIIAWQPLPPEYKEKTYETT
jgi:hypothetical protein